MGGILRTGVRTPVRAVAWLAILAGLGCDGTDVFFVEADSDLPRNASFPGVDGGMPVAPTLPEAPSPPDLPQWDCPEDWTPVESFEGSACEPWVGGFGTCPLGEIRTPGSTACDTLGDMCPAGDFAEPRPSEDPRWFVRPGATGIGTRDQPFGSVATALGQAAPGDAIFLARGTYQEAVRVTQPVTLVGACASATVFDAPDTAGAPTLTVSAAQVGLRGIGVRGGGGAGLLVEANGEVHGEGLFFDQIPGMAVAVEAGTAELTQLHVRDSGAGRGTSAAGVRVRQGGSLTLDHALIEGSRLHGILALDDGTEVTLQDLAIRTTSEEGLRAEPLAAGLGAGLWLGFGARGTLQRAAIESNVRVGVVVTSRANLVASHLVVRDSVPNAVGDWGEGVFVEAASLDLRKALIDNNTRTGVRLDERQSVGPAPVMHLEDVTIRRTQPRPEDDRLGQGLKATSPDARTVEEQAVLTGTRILIDDNHRAGIRGEDAQLTFTDVTVRGTRVSPGDADGGFGFRVSGGTLEVTRALVSENREAGVHVDMPGTRLTLTDVVICDTKSRAAPGIGGRGINAVAGTAVQLERAVFERNHETAIAVYGPSSRLSLEDVTIRDTYGRSADGRFGAAITVEATDVVGSRVLVERSRQVALWIGRESELSLSDVSIRDTLPQDCAETGCPAFGVGVGAYQASQLDLDRFDIVGASLCGVQVAARGQLDLTHGTVAENVFGVCLGEQTYDVTRLAAEVAYTNNDRNIEARALPIPDPSPPLIISSSD